mgnify:CR=1 FL=1
MRVLVDTTYLLPAIGVAVEGVPRGAVLELVERGYEVCVSEVSLFELSAKGAKYAAAGALDPGRVARGVRAILYDERIGKVPPYDTPVLLLALELRRVLRDFVDCVILSSAANWADVLATEDGDLLELAASREFEELVLASKPEFKIARLRDLL